MPVTNDGKPLSIKELIEEIENDNLPPEVCKDYSGVIAKIKNYLIYDSDYDPKHLDDNNVQIKRIRSIYATVGNREFHFGGKTVKLENTGKYKKFKIKEEAYDSKIADLRGSTENSDLPIKAKLDSLEADLKAVYKDLNKSVDDCFIKLKDLENFEAEELKNEKELRNANKKKAKIANGSEPELTVGELLNDIIGKIKGDSRKLPAVIVKNYDNEIKKIKKMLVYYSGCYKNDICPRDSAVQTRVIALGLKESDVFNTYKGCLQKYQGTINELRSSDKKSNEKDNIFDNEPLIDEIFNELEKVYKPLLAAEEAINEHIKDKKDLRDSLVANYVEISEQCRKYAEKFNSKKDELNALDKEHTRLYYEVLKLEAEVNAKTTEIDNEFKRRFVTQNRKITMQSEKVKLEEAYNDRKKELDEHEKKFAEKQKEWDKYVKKYKDLSQQKIDLGKALINAGVAKRAEKEVLLNEIEQTGKTLSDTLKEVLELRKKFDEQLKKVPGKWGALKSKLLREKDRVSRRESKKQAQETKKKLEEATKKLEKNQAKKVRLERDYNNQAEVEEGNGKRIEYVDRGDISKKEFLSKVVKLTDEELSNSKDRQEQRKGKTKKEIDIQDKETKSAEEKKCLDMCNQIIKVLEDIHKKNPKGFPFLGQEFYKEVIKSGSKYKNSKDMILTTYKAKDVNILLSSLDRLFGHDGIMRQLADNYFTKKGDTGRSGFHTVSALVEAEYSKFLMNIDGKALQKKLDDMEKISIPKEEEAEFESFIKSLRKTTGEVNRDINDLLNTIEKSESGILNKIKSKTVGKLKNKLKSWLFDEQSEGLKKVDGKKGKIESVSSNFNEMHKQFDEYLNESKDSSHNKLTRYATVSTCICAWLASISAFIPEVGPIISASIGLASSTVGIGFKIAKLVTINYSKDPMVRLKQHNLLNKVKKTIEIFNNMNKFYKEIITCDSEGVLSKQESIEKSWSNIIGSINKALYAFGAKCHEKFDKYEHYSLNLHVSAHLRALHKAKALFKKIADHVMDFEKYNSLPEELKY